MKRQEMRNKRLQKQYNRILYIIKDNKQGKVKIRGRDLKTKPRSKYLQVIKVLDTLVTELTATK